MNALASILRQGSGGPALAAPALRSLGEAGPPPNLMARAGMPGAGLAPPGMGMPLPGPGVPLGTPQTSPAMAVPSPSPGAANTPRPGQQPQQNPLQQILAQVAGMGRKGDNKIGHVTDGDLVFPIERMTPKVFKFLHRELGDDIARFIVGAKQNSRNPATGLPEFQGDSDGSDGSGSGMGDGSAGSIGGGLGGQGIGSGGGGGPGGQGAGDAPGGAGPGSVGERAGSGASSSAVSGMSPPDARGFLSTSPSVDPQGYGNRSIFSGTAGSFGQPTTGIGFIDNKLNNAVNNPISTALNIGAGFIPGVGFANTLSGLLGGPTIGGTLTAGGRAFGSDAAYGGSGTGYGGGGYGGFGAGDHAGGGGYAAAPGGVPGAAGPGFASPTNTLAALPQQFGGGTAANSWLPSGEMKMVNGQLVPVSQSDIAQHGVDDLAFSNLMNPRFGAQGNLNAQGQQINMLDPRYWVS